MKGLHFQYSLSTFVKRCAGTIRKRGRSGSRLEKGFARGYGFRFRGAVRRQRRSLVRREGRGLRLRLNDVDAALKKGRESSDAAVLQGTAAACAGAGERSTSSAA